MKSLLIKAYQKQQVKDYLWFLIIISSLAGIKFGLKTFHVNDTQVFFQLKKMISLSYVAIMDATGIFMNEPYSILDENRFYFYKKNMTFIIHWSCAALSHYLLYTGLIAFFPYFNIRTKVYAIVIGMAGLYLVRLLILFIQTIIFVKFNDYYEYIHGSSGYILLTAIFVTWILMLKFRDDQKNTLGDAEVM